MRPRRIPASRPGVALAGELALQAGRRRLALQILEEGWKAAPHPDIAQVYATVDPGESASQRQKRIDTRLAPLNRTHPETLVLQAEVAMQAGDWDSARSRLEAALDAQPTARVYRLLAELERQSRGDSAKAQEWLARATDAEPDRTWVCDDTGEVLAAWQPLAPSGRFDAVHWSTPPKVATMLGAEADHLHPAARRRIGLAGAAAARRRPGRGCMSGAATLTQGRGSASRRPCPSGATLPVRRSSSVGRAADS